MITRPQRERTRWDWKPLIVIPMMVYLNAAPQEPSRYYDMSAISEGGSKNRAEPAVAAPVQGVDSKGAAFIWERNPKYPVIEFRMSLKQPNTIVDR